jgi:hypothetical protein
MMTAPYYDDGKVTLYLGDCREITEWLAAAILCMDPPYGIGWKRGSVKGDNPHAGIANDEDTSVRDAALALWGDRPALVFGSFYAPQPADVRHVAVYRKPPDSGLIGSTTGLRRDVEPIFLVGNWPKVAAKRSSLIATAVGSLIGQTAARYRNDRGTGHPHTKPLDVMEQLIDACPPGVIADPFAGSGSTLVAARNLGRRAIGVELEERYCEVVARRLAQDCLDFGAFA